jgi:hypothetical protein
MTDPIQNDKSDLDDAGIGENEPEVAERGDEDEEQVDRAPQPGNTPAPSPPFDSSLPREREEQ